MVNISLAHSRWYWERPSHHPYTTSVQQDWIR